MGTTSATATPVTAAKQVKRWEQAWTVHCEPLQLAHNEKKRQLSVNFTGEGARTSMAEVTDAFATQGVKGTITSSVKHLGGWAHNRGANHDDIRERLSRARVAWCTLGKVWTTTSISLRVRLLLFRTLVIAVLLSGLEVAALTKHEIHALDTFQVRQLRVLLLDLAKFKTNDWLRTFTKVPTVDSALRSRRLHWLKSLLRDPHEHAVVLAAAMGHPAIRGAHKSLDLKGIPATFASPWLRQWWSDFQVLAEQDDHYKHILTHGGMFAIQKDTRFQFLQTHRPLSSVLGDQRTNRRGPLVEYCTDAHQCPIVVEGHACNQAFDSARALEAHLVWKHGLRVKRRAVVITNQCPWCSAVFPTIQQAKQHAAKTIGAQVCPRRRSTLAELVVPLHPSCPLCSQH